MTGSNYGTGEAIAPGNTSNVLTLPVFDPNAGKQAVYDNRWKEYLTELGKLKKRINLNKAQKYFDSLFEQDWNNEATSRQIDFISQQARLKQLSIIDKWKFERAEADRISLEQDALDYEAAGYTYDATTGKWNKPVTLISKPKTDWNAVAASKLGTGKTMKDVEALQNKMKGLGFNVGTVDGMWGTNTQKAYDLYLQYLNNPATYDGYTHLGSNRGYHYYLDKNGKVYMGGANDIIKTPQDQVYLDPSIKTKLASTKEQGAGTDVFTSNTFNSAGKKFTGTFNNMDEFNNAFTDWYGKRNGFWLGGSYNEGRKWDSARDLMLQEYLKYYNLTSLPNAQKPKSSSNNVVQPWRVVAAHKNGGNVNKYQQGGNMNDKELLKAFITYLIEDAAAQGMQIQTEQDLQAYAQQLGKEGLKAKYQEFMQKMQGGIKAALGAKLDYINKLKGICPEGSEKIYLKSGGCMCKQKASLGGKAETNAIELFKKLKNPNKVEQNDTIHHNKQVYDLTGKHKLFKQLTNKEYRNLPTDKQADVDNKDMMRAKNTEKKACGGKAKKSISKHLGGGGITSRAMVGPQKPTYNIKSETPNISGPVDWYDKVYSKLDLPYKQEGYIPEEVDKNMSLKLEEAARSGEGVNNWMAKFAKKNLDPYSLAIYKRYLEMGAPHSRGGAVSSSTRPAGAIPVAGKMF